MLCWKRGYDYSKEKVLPSFHMPVWSFIILKGKILFSEYLYASLFTFCPKQKKCWFCKNTTELIFQCKVKYVNKWPKIAPFCAPNSKFFWGACPQTPPVGSGATPPRFGRFASSLFTSANCRSLFIFLLLAALKT